MLDRIPPFYRHFILLAMSWVITNAGSALTHLHLSPALAGAAGVGLTLVVEVFTPITRQYGVGKEAATTVNTGAATPAA